MRITLLAISPFILALTFLGFSLACAGPSGGGSEDTGGSSSTMSCYDQGYQDCADGYALSSTCNSSEYCDGYCNCDGYGDDCADCY
jgi:hypothetical protein